MANGFLPSSLMEWLAALGDVIGAASLAGGALWWLLRGYIDRAVRDEQRDRKVADEQMDKLVFEHAQKIHTLLARMEELRLQVESGFSKLEGIMEGREQARREMRDRARDREHD